MLIERNCLTQRYCNNCSSSGDVFQIFSCKLEKKIIAMILHWSWFTKYSFKSFIKSNGSERTLLKLKIFAMKILNMQDTQNKSSGSDEAMCLECICKKNIRITQPKEHFKPRQFCSWCYCFHFIEVLNSIFNADSITLAILVFALLKY